MEQEKKNGNPERERERGKPVVSTTPPKVDVGQDVAVESLQVAAAPMQVAGIQIVTEQGAGASSRVLTERSDSESSDDPDKDLIKVQEFKVKMETVKLVRKELLRRKR